MFDYFGYNNIRIIRVFESFTPVPVSDISVMFPFFLPMPISNFH